MRNARRGRCQAWGLFPRRGAGWSHRRDSLFFSIGFRLVVHSSDMHVPAASSTIAENFFWAHVKYLWVTEKVAMCRRGDEERALMTC